MADAFMSGILTVIAHAVVAVAGIAAVTVLAALHTITGTDALLVIMGVLGISGPSLGRPTMTSARTPARR